MDDIPRRFAVVTLGSLLAALTWVSSPAVAALAP